MSSCLRAHNHLSVSPSPLPIARQSSPVFFSFPVLSSAFFVVAAVERTAFYAIIDVMFIDFNAYVSLSHICMPCLYSNDKQRFQFQKAKKNVKLCIFRKHTKKQAKYKKAQRRTNVKWNRKTMHGEKKNVPTMRSTVNGRECFSYSTIYG